jgi:hypothetical protein
MGEREGRVEEKRGWMDEWEEEKREEEGIWGQE